MEHAPTVRGLTAELREAALQIAALRAQLDEGAVSRLTDSLLDGYALFDPAAVVLDVNPALCAMTGFTAEELVGTAPPHPCWPAEELDRFMAAMADVVTGRSRPVELHLLRKDDARIPVLATPSVLRGDDGEVVSVSLLFRDQTDRLAAERALRESEERYRLLLQNANDAVYVHEVTERGVGRFVEVNDRACKMLGYSREEFLAMDVGRIDTPEQHARTPAIVEALLRTGSSLFETEHVARDGRRIPVEVSTRAFELQGRTVIFSVVRDISERVAAETALREARRLLDETQEISRLGGWEYDVAAGRFTWTEELYRLHGVDLDHDVDDLRSNIGFYAPEDQAVVDAAFAGILETGVPYDLELQFRPAGADRPIWVRTTARAEMRDGRVVRVVGNLTDIDERKQADEALAAERERAQTYLDIAGVMIVAIGSDGVVTVANRKACQVLGRDEAGVVGQDWFRLAIPGEVSAAVREVFDGLMSGEGEPRDFYENEVVTATGVRRLIAWHNALLHDADGAVTGTLSSGEDVTERRRAEAEITRLNEELQRRVASRTEQLEASTRELEALAYSVAHDVRAPLRAIDGFSAVVLEDEAATMSDGSRESLQRVRAAAQTLARLLDELSGLSRVARRELTREAVDLTALAGAVGDELAAENPSRVVHLTVAPGLAAFADPELARVLVRELLGNAWKFTAPHETARIEVGAVESDGERAFFVRDDGVGFDMHYAEHLFGAFQRMHALGEFEGDGIGLATVQRLVRRHGGRCWAEAEVEKGATVFFTLPEPAAAR
jgi:PAS domain S-box-containing protein